MAVIHVQTVTHNLSVDYDIKKSVLSYYEKVPIFVLLVYCAGIGVESVSIFFSATGSNAATPYFSTSNNFSNDKIATSTCLSSGSFVVKSWSHNPGYPKYFSTGIERTAFVSCKTN